MHSTEILRLAAEALRAVNPTLDPRVAQFLEALEYAPAQGAGRSGASPPADSRDVEMLRFASQFDDIFRLDSRFAPGLAFFGGVVSPTLAGVGQRLAPNVSVTGRGMTLRKAFEGCVGEAVEFISQWERDDDMASQEDFDHAAQFLDQSSRRELGYWVTHSQKQPRPLDWIAATRLSDGQSVRLPADFCLRRLAEKRALQPPFLMGTGTAAGETLEAATLHGVLELIERDALGLWWKGGRRGFDIDNSSAEFELTLGALRRGRNDRKTWLLDITTDLLAPCVVAISCGPDGDRFAFGVAARLHVVDAARTALLELCQLELALDIVDRKARERGTDALNDADRQHLSRAAAINANACALVQPLARRRAATRSPGNLDEIIAHASGIGVEFHRVDITRPQPGIAAVRIVAPTLQLEPSQLVSKRLQQVVAKTGGGDKYTLGVQLL